MDNFLNPFGIEPEDDTQPWFLWSQEESEPEPTGGARILLNSGGGIVIKDSQIVLLPDDLTPEECECCGPPQPPPPDCTRCSYIDPMTDLPVFYAPLQKEFAVIIQDTTDTYTWSLQQYMLEELALTECGCFIIESQINIDVTITGLAGLNGTRYGVPQYINNPFGGFSDVPSCNSSNMAFDPTATTPHPLCATEDDCEYDCILQVWLKDAMLSGTFNCSGYRRVTCTNDPTRSSSNSQLYSIPLSGFATLNPPTSIYSYGGSIVIPYSILGRVWGQVATDYGTRGVSIGFTDGYIQTGSIGSWICNAPLPRSIAIDNPADMSISCPGTVNQPDLSCYPFWRIVRTAHSDTCDTSIISPPLAQEIDVAACNYNNERITDFPSVYGCMRRVTQQVSLSSSAFYSSYRYEWS